MTATMSSPDHQGWYRNPKHRQTSVPLLDNPECSELHMMESVNHQWLDHKNKNVARHGKDYTSLDQRHTQKNPISFWVSVVVSMGFLKISSARRPMAWAS